jgi:hypothetical protein
VGSGEWWVRISSAKAGNCNSATGAWVGVLYVVGVAVADGGLHRCICTGVRFGIMVETLEFEWWASPLTGCPPTSVVPKQ